MHGSPPSLVLYLHGFRSSPLSAKASRLASWLRGFRPEVTWWCPQLPPSPKLAMALVERRLQGHDAAALAVVGSSLGGFYATHVAQRTGCRSVVLNPAVDPARDLAAYVGELATFHDPEVRFRFEASFLDELRELDTGAPLRHPDRCLAVIAKGDELLDWTEMAARYEGCHRLLIEGSDHGLSDFDLYLDTIVNFLGLRSKGAN